MLTCASVGGQRRAGVLLALLFVLTACSGHTTKPSGTLASVVVDGKPPAIGSSAQFTATATFSDGRTEVVTANVTWSSSNSAVATVNGTGLVTGIASGDVDITATYQNVSGRMHVALAPPPVSSGVVRALYVVPSDRGVRNDYHSAVESALSSVQNWYAGQLGGKTFSMSGPLQNCALPRTADYYASDSWSKILQDVQSCAPVSTNTSATTVWVLYVDIIHACNAPGRLGAGTAGVTMLPRQDMDGLIGARYFYDCGEEFVFPPSRYVGGLAHEMGHAFGLPHPPGCDAGQSSCDQAALMWSGYVNFPNTYFRPDEKSALLSTAFFR